MKKTRWIVLGCLLAMPVGCGGNSETASSAVNKTVSHGSSAAGGQAANPTNGTIPPNEIVAMFADSIRRGDRNRTNELITADARREIVRQGIELDPPGSPEASYKIGDFRYVDEDKDAGFVESLWIEPGDAGQPQQATEVVWAVRLEEGGWRISGLAIDMGKDQPAAIVNFEDLEGAVVDPQAGKDKVAGTATTPPAGQQFVAPGANQAQPTQIATPPGSNPRR